MRRTMRGWFEHLDDDRRELTLEEFAALMSLHEREYARLALEHLREIRLASEHTEGMLGAIDQLAEGIAVHSGLPYAASSAVRLALHAARRGEGE